MSLALLGGGTTSSCLETTLGIRSLEDGLARLFNGMVRRMDVLKFHDLEANKATYGVSAVYGSFASGLKGTSWTPFLSKSGTGKLQTYLNFSRSYEAKLINIVAGSDASLDQFQPLIAGNEYTSIVFSTTRHLSNSYMTDAFNLAPEAKLDDGHLHIAMLPSMTVPEKVHLFTELAAGKSPDAIRRLEVSSVTLQPTSRGRELHSQPRSVGLDSDICGGGPCTISVLPRALRILA